MSRYDKDGLTTREREILDYIIQFKNTNGFSPTISEISQNFFYPSRTFVRSVIYKLDCKGFIRYDEQKRRSIVVLRFPTKTA